jgi:hypothetical protein
LIQLQKQLKEVEEMLAKKAAGSGSGSKLLKEEVRSHIHTPRCF